ncbi:SOS response-associated peptidase [Kutzneria viridogrisea]|uniref:Abasic site processing protein n=1 Tax=Kutzneria viridogrisea TaxID=47990 RepID=A0ABR6BSJ2_9PSEU|nr:putative SOS response-associated peptidase YedK [Kutzneria viridogrisea]
MCGRCASTRSSATLAAEFDAIDQVGDAARPSYNVAPTQQVRVVLERSPRDEPDAPPQRRLTTARWGLVPSWAKDPKIGSRMINARAESFLEKPSFKAAARRRRALIPADGYYEWQKTSDGAKVPHFLHRGDELLALAGLYELWRDPERADDDPDRWRLTCTILTTTAPDTLGHVHDRCPVIIPQELHEDWLDPSITDPAAVHDLLAGVPQPHLEPRVVSSRVNNVHNDTPDLIEPANRA